MNSQYTPGPWLFDKEDGQIYEQQTSFQSAIASVVETKYSDYSGDWKANGKLIAAAPDLLEALIELEQWSTSDEERMPEGTFEIVRAAIAKAIG